MRRSVLLTAFGVSAFVLELETLLILKLIRDGITADTVMFFSLGQAFVFIAFCIGYYTIAHDVHSNFHLYPDEETSIFLVIKTRPVEFLLPPLVFVAVFLLLFTTQTGLIFLMDSFGLPTWFFPVVFFLQFLAAVGSIIVGCYLVIHLFLWYSHVRTREYKFKALLSSFNSLLTEKTYRIFSYAFLWVLISVLAFMFVFFPMWKLAATQTISASRIALGDRFEREVTGSDTVLADLSKALEEPAFTPYGSLLDFLAQVGDNQPGKPDPYRVKEIPRAGFFFLAALVLTFALPVGMMLAIFAAAGGTCYRAITSSKQPSSTLPGRTSQALTRKGANTMAESPLFPKEPGDEASPKEDDTLVDLISPEPIEDFFGTTHPALRKKTGRAARGDVDVRKNAVDKYVDFGYVGPGDNGGSPFAQPPKISPSMKIFDDDAEKEKKFIREPKKQDLPEKKSDKDEGDYTIFDKM
ncbi:MAG: hypothetical protein Kow00107_08170 [Planctomycetota bacterium]